MSANADWDNIPSSIKNSDKTFVEKLKRDYDKNRSFASFISFPYRVHFEGQEPSEHVVLLLRQHWIVLLKPALLIALLILLSFFSVPYVRFITDGAPGALRYATAASLTLWILAFSIGVNAFVRWYYTVNVVTDQRVVDLDFVNVLNHSYAEAQLEHIEDVSHSHKGVMSTLFDYGTVVIQTAAAKVEIEFDNIPRPRDAQDVLSDLLEMNQEASRGFKSTVD